MNNNLIPVNRPKCPVHSYHRDGQMRTDGNYGDTAVYEPNSFGEWHDTPSRKEPPLTLHGDAYDYDERRLDDDYYAARQTVAPDADRQASHLPEYRGTDEECRSSSARGTCAPATMPIRNTRDARAGVRHQP